jgi:hypothetical protein
MVQTFELTVLFSKSLYFAGAVPYRDPSWLIGESTPNGGLAANLFFWSLMEIYRRFRPLLRELGPKRFLMFYWGYYHAVLVMGQRAKWVQAPAGAWSV